ncbi:MAG: ComEC/Rec2 family competence protein [Candidatus Moranbacteria bacterium]|nr:ComEC/Rec2 family competence protein [Candidatus Moranbacteria bacterium]
MGEKAEIKISKSKIFFILSLAFLIGVFLASFFPIEKYFILILVSSGIIVFVINYKNKKIIIASAAILFLALGIWRTEISFEDAKNNLADQKLGSVEFTRTVTKEPETDEKYQKVIVEDNEKNKILINADVYPQYQYGDELKVRCILEEPKNYEDSNFDYQMYLAKDGIYRVCNKAQITAVASNKGNKFYTAILAAKKRFEEKISAIFPDPEGAYLKGLILGGGKRMTQDLNDAFSKTGTTHTVAVSGYNVTIVAAFLMWLGIALGLWRQQVFSFALIGIVLFVLMTGAPSSAVRAGIMGGLVIWAMKEGRLANSQNAILFAAAIMLLINPLLLRYDAGFQLSFLATLGIIYVYPLFEKNFFAGEQNILKETILMTLAAQVFVLPVILNSFQKLSVISPLANLLILPAIPQIMLGGFAAGMAGFVFVPLGKLIGFVPYVLLKVELLIIQWLANLSWSSLEIKNFSWLHISVYYLILVSVLYYFKRKDKKLSLAQK